MPNLTCDKTSKRRVSTLAYALLLWVCFHGVSTAQVNDPAQLAVAADCIQKTISGNPQIDVEIEFEVGPAGDIVGLPVMTAPAAARSAHRQFYFFFASALEGCAPFRDGLERQSYKAKYSQGNLTITGAPAAQSALLQETPPALKQLPPLRPLPPLKPVPENGTAESETALALDKQAIRDIQARLSVLGHDPNGIDGVMGRGTRGAIQAWQASRGFPATGYLSASQMVALRIQSEAQLQSWLAFPDNSDLYNPPPPIPIGPTEMSGNWRFTTTCGTRSKIGQQKITGAMKVRHVGGGNYTGQVKTSQGFTGRFNGRLSGRRMSGEINYGFLLGRVRSNGVVADQKLAISGRDSNGCSFYAAKTS